MRFAFISAGIEKNKVQFVHVFGSAFGFGLVSGYMQKHSYILRQSIYFISVSVSFWFKCEMTLSKKSGIKYIMFMSRPEQFTCIHV